MIIYIDSKPAKLCWQFADHALHFFLLPLCTLDNVDGPSPRQGASRDKERTFHPFPSRKGKEKKKVGERKVLGKTRLKPVAPGEEGKKMRENFLTSSLKMLTTGIDNIGSMSPKTPSKILPPKKKKRKRKREKKKRKGKKKKRKKKAYSGYLPPASHPFPNCFIAATLTLWAFWAVGENTRLIVHSVHLLRLLRLLQSTALPVLVREADSGVEGS
jgi:hypothetical protein